MLCRTEISLGRLTKRTPTHTPVPPNPVVLSPVAVSLASFLNSFYNAFFCYE